MDMPTIPLSPETAGTTAADTRQGLPAQSGTPFSQVLSEEIAQHQRRRSDTAKAVLPDAARPNPEPAAGSTAAEQAASPLPAQVLHLSATGHPAVADGKAQAAPLGQLAAANTPAVPLAPQASPAPPTVPAADALSPASTEASAQTQDPSDAPAATEAGATPPQPQPAAAAIAVPAAGPPPEAALAADSQPGRAPTAASTAPVTAPPAALPEAGPAAAARPAENLQQALPMPARESGTEARLARFELPAEMQAVKAEPLPGAGSELGTSLAPPAAAGPALPARADAPAQAPAMHHYRLTPPVGTQAWSQALGDRISWMVAGGEQTASLTLNPPELGPLQVVLSLSSDQASANFFAAQADVRQAIEAALPRLREMMNEAGVLLGEATVSADLPQQNGAGDQQSRQPGSRFGGQHGQSGQLLTGELSLPARAGLGLVDTYA